MGRIEKTGKDLFQMGYPVELVATETYVNTEIFMHKI